jgi:YHS domain-containing protein
MYVMPATRLPKVISVCGRANQIVNFLLISWSLYLPTCIGIAFVSDLRLVPSGIVGIPRRKGEKFMEITVHDPVCHMDIDPKTATGTSEYKGQTYYFCSMGCKRSFDKDPEKYIGREQEHQHS